VNDTFLMEYFVVPAKSSLGICWSTEILLKVIKDNEKSNI
jgi:hypothetical protein